MARILICEPAAEARELIARQVARLGHDPVGPGAGDDVLAGVDVALVEPARTSLRRRAERVWERSPDARIVVASIYPPHEDDGDLALSHLLKPFTLAQLRRALDAALDAPAQRRAAAAHAV